MVTPTTSETISLTLSNRMTLPEPEPTGQFDFVTHPYADPLPPPEHALRSHRCRTTPGVGFVSRRSVLRCGLAVFWLLQGFSTALFLGPRIIAPGPPPEVA